MVEHSLLSIKPDTKEYTLKLNNLEKPEKLEQAVEIIDQWIKKQAHFLKKDYDRRYLENAVFTAKGSIEKAKEKLEKMCIMKTMLPKFFEFKDIRVDFKNILSTQCAGIPLPTMTPEYHRVCVYRMVQDESFHNLTMMDFYKFFLIVYEYLKIHDWCAGYVFIIDLRKANIFDVVTKINILDFKHIASLLLEAQGLQLKSLIYLTPSRAIDALLRIVKPVLSAKIAHRVQVCKDEESLHELVPKEILPEELGGGERSCMEIQEDWIAALSEKENIDYLVEMRGAGVTEDYKEIIKNNDKFPDMAGSFVTLEFD